MTIIVGATDGTTVVLGADSRTTWGDLVRPNVTPKVWRHHDLGIVLGVSGRVREQQILRHFTALPSSVPTDSDAIEPWLCGPFVDAVRDGQPQCEYGPVVMIGVGGRLFILHGDYSVSEYPDGGAVGSGQTAAWGSLHTSRSLALTDPRARVLLALEAACAHDTGCAPPFDYVTTDDTGGRQSFVDEPRRIDTLDDLDALVGQRVQLGFYGWRYNDDPLEWGTVGTLGRDGDWLTLDGNPKAHFNGDGSRDTPHIMVRRPTDEAES